MLRRIYLLVVGLMICSSMSYADITNKTHSHSRFWELFEYSLNANAEFIENNKYSLNFKENVSGWFIWYSFELNYKGHKVQIYTANGGRDDSKEFSIHDISTTKKFDDFTQIFVPIVDLLFGDGLVFGEITSVTPVESFEIGMSEQYMEYHYCWRGYSATSHQLINSGMMSEQLDRSFDFWLGEGHRIGEWLDFVVPVVSKAETWTGELDYAYVAIPQEFDNELHISSEKEAIVKWTLNEHDLSFYLSVGKRMFYFEVKLGESPMLIRSVEERENKLIEYQYNADGCVESLMIRSPESVEIYEYDSEEGFLTRKRTISKGTSDICVEETFDVSKEYRKFTSRHDDIITVE